MTENDKLIRNDAEAIECLKSNKPTSGYVMLQESIDMAIKALEKQIPKKPTDRCMYKECPACGEVEIEFCKYCPSCGQNLDWSEEK